jgi:hypothetical protein
MKRIDRKYAIIYVDSNGDSLGDVEDFTTNEMVSDYYSAEGFQQWNFYLIVPAELFASEEQKTEFINNDKYTRKYIVSKDNIGRFIEKNFPKMGTQFGKVTMIKSNNHRQSVKLLELEGPKTKRVSSLLRDINVMDTLSELDKIRVGLLTNKYERVAFCTHIDNEYTLAERKFKPFI